MRCDGKEGILWKGMYIPATVSNKCHWGLVLVTCDYSEDYMTNREEVALTVNWCDSF